MQTAVPITRVVPLSVAKVAAFYYGFWGTVSALLYAFTNSEGWLAPFGFWTVFLKFTANLSFRMHNSISVTIIEMLIVAFAYTLTGWLTGLIGAAGYNLASKYLGLCFDGTTEQNPS
jgi:hypothetical protein